MLSRETLATPTVVVFKVGTMSEHDTVSRVLHSAALHPELAIELEKFRRNIVVMFTDIKGSTAYFERFGDSAGLLMVHSCNELLGKTAERHGGRVIKTIGDAIMAAFDDANDGVLAAIEMQRAVTKENVAKPEAARVAIRIGLNYGLGITKSNDVFGDVVNTASRVETAAAPRQILVSDSLRNVLPPNTQARLRHAGRFELKGKAETRDLFEVIWDEDEPTTVSIAHSLVAAESRLAELSCFKLQQIRRDGSAGTEHAFQHAAMLLGRLEGDLVFNHDLKLQPLHARLSISSGQMFVETIRGSSVFLSLVGPYRLEDGDVIKMGEHMFAFHAHVNEIENAAATGTKIRDLVRMLRKSPAEFVSLDADKKCYPIAEEQVTWGRTKATYMFADDPHMSRSHARVYYRGEDFILEDMGSRNGTFLKVREKAPVPAGAILSLGGQLFRVNRSAENQESVTIAS
jgi:class 3 adenylate cyclase